MKTKLCIHYLFLNTEKSTAKISQIHTQPSLKVISLG